MADIYIQIADAYRDSARLHQRCAEMLEAQGAVIDSAERKRQVLRRAERQREYALETANIARRFAVGSLIPVGESEEERTSAFLSSVDADRGDDRVDTATCGCPIPCCDNDPVPVQ